MRRFVKFFGVLMLGYLLAVITHFPYKTVIDRKLSPNKRYVAEYYCLRRGGLIPLQYNHFISLVDTESGRHILSYFTKDADVKGLPDDVFWDNDHLVCAENTFYSNDKKLQKIELTKDRTVFYFPKGYATE